MSIKNLVQRDLVTIQREATAQEAAQALKTEGVGSIIVLEGDEPVGLLTDRDLAIRVVAEGRDPTGTRIQDVMSAPLRTIDAGLDFLEAIDIMADEGVRRLPVAEDGQLVGILTLDDVFGVVTSQIARVETVLLAQSKPPRRGEGSA